VGAAGSELDFDFLGMGLPVRPRIQPVHLDRLAGLGRRSAGVLRRMHHQSGHAQQTNADEQSVFRIHAGPPPAVLWIYAITVWTLPPTAKMRLPSRLDACRSSQHW